MYHWISRFSIIPLFLQFIIPDDDSGGSPPGGEGGQYNHGQGGVDSPGYNNSTVGSNDNHGNYNDTNQREQRTRRDLKEVEDASPDAWMRLTMRYRRRTPSSSPPPAEEDKKLIPLVVERISTRISGVAIFIMNVIKIEQVEPRHMEMTMVSILRQHQNILYSREFI